MTDEQIQDELFWLIDHLGSPLNKKYDFSKAAEMREFLAVFAKHLKSLTEVEK